MVVMSVAQHYGIDGSNVNAEQRCVFHERVCLTGICEDTVLFGLYVDTEPVLRDAPLAKSTVLNERYRAHTRSSASFTALRMQSSQEHSIFPVLSPLSSPQSTLPHSFLNAP